MLDNIQKFQIPYPDPKSYGLWLDFPIFWEFWEGLLPVKHISPRFRPMGVGKEVEANATSFASVP